jgi:hypothetical protein
MRLFLIASSSLACWSLVACGGAQSTSAAPDAAAQDASTADARFDATTDAITDANANPDDSANASDSASPDDGANPGDSASPDDAGDGPTWAPPLHGCGLSAIGFVQYAPDAGVLSLTCPGTDKVVLSNPQVVALDGGALASIPPGATTIVGATVTNNGPQGLSYPCLALSTDNPAVTLGAGGPSLYSLSGPGRGYGVDVTFGSSIAPGTHVRFAAWAGWWGGDTPDGAVIGCVSTPPLVWDVTVN